MTEDQKVEWQWKNRVRSRLNTQLTLVILITVLVLIHHAYYFPKKAKHDNQFQESTINGLLNIQDRTKELAAQLDELTRALNKGCQR